MKRLLFLPLLFFCLLCGKVWAIPPSPPVDVDGAISTHSADTAAHSDIDLVQVSETCVAMGSDTTPVYDLSAGTCYTDTIDTGETTATFSNPAATGHLSSLTLILTNGGSQTFNWPASVHWVGGTAPTLTAAGIDIIECMTIDGGTIWYCFTAGFDLK